MRPRKKDRHLPACMYLRSGSYYLVKGGKWVMIGKSLKDALKEYGRRLSTDSTTMPALLDRYMDSVKDRLAQKTLNSYGTGKNHLATALVEYQPHQIDVRTLLELRHGLSHSPGTWNIMRTVLIGALDLAIIEGIVDRNVARDTKRLKTNVRDRYIDDVEFSSIRKEASPFIQVVMDLLYLTGQRISDVLAMKRADIREDGIHIKQGKTGTRMVMAWDTDLRDVVARAKALHQSVKGLTLLHKRNGDPIGYDYVSTHWDKACKAAGIEDAHLHDIRAKAGTDANKAGMDSKALLGHKSESAHQRYLRSKEVPVVQPMSFRKAK